LQAIRIILTNGGLDADRDKNVLPSAATIITRHPSANPPVVEHCFIFWDWLLEMTVVPNGFASGYGGAGPHALAYALIMVESKDIPLFELKVDGERFERIASNRLSADDVSFLRENGKQQQFADMHTVLAILDDSDPLKDYRFREFNKYYVFSSQSKPRVPWEWLDPEIAVRGEPLARTSYRSALAEAFLILKSQFVEQYNLPDTKDGEVLVNLALAVKGVFLSSFAEVDDDRTKEVLALRDMLAGLFKVLRNTYVHLPAEPPVQETATVLLMLTHARRLVRKYQLPRPPAPPPT